ncbi:hypothetical protein IC620_10375 [Hazenella sp. IB182357]|uniref:Uncharacterized protein n=1 Tax=Polycladospora coralii TaxID=2771432 RepID=A0A926NAX5_9BACL|nr:hypothetical protein [Polycladospora coralii]MBD1372762.1 hypothetical protein [Polycladospora coralii]MBS7531154.1 hypothetical protein [Polycladospora coralii]
MCIKKIFIGLLTVTILLSSLISVPTTYAKPADGGIVKYKFLAVHKLFTPNDHQSGNVTYYIDETEYDDGIKYSGTLKVKGDSCHYDQNGLATSCWYEGYLVNEYSHELVCETVTVKGVQKYWCPRQGFPEETTRYYAAGQIPAEYIKPTPFTEYGYNYIGDLKLQSCTTSSSGSKNCTYAGWRVRDDLFNCSVVTINGQKYASCRKPHYLAGNQP